MVQTKNLGNHLIAPHLGITDTDTTALQFGVSFRHHTHIALIFDDSEALHAQCRQ